MLNRLHPNGVAFLQDVILTWLAEFDARGGAIHEEGLKKERQVRLAVPNAASGKQLSPENVLGTDSESRANYVPQTLINAPTGP